MGESQYVLSLFFGFKSRERYQVWASRQFCRLNSGNTSPQTRFYQPNTENTLRNINFGDGFVRLLALHVCVALPSGRWCGCFLFESHIQGNCFPPSVRHLRLLKTGSTKHRAHCPYSRLKPKNLMAFT